MRGYVGVAHQGEHRPTTLQVLERNAEFAADIENAVITLVPLLGHRDGTAT